MRLPRIRLEVSLMIVMAVSAAPAALAVAGSGSREHAFGLYAAGRLQEAVSELDRVIDSRPRDIEALTKRGNCYLRLDQPQRALPDFERVIKLSPMNPSARRIEASRC